VRIKTFLCHCEGLCEGLKGCDLSTLPLQIESELNVDFVIVHPKLCGPAGNQMLREVLKSAAADTDTYVVVCGCAPTAQARLFQKVFLNTGFDKQRFVALDIRDDSNAHIVQHLRERLEALVGGEKDETPVKAMTAAG
jgi:heterodisulfide reductase subunit A-like polyferredoxin